MDFRCPACKTQITLKQRRDFVDWSFGFRKAAPCPYCQTIIQYSKWPYREIIGGNTLIFVTMILMTTFYNDNDDLPNIFLFLIILGGAITLIGLICNHFERVEKNDQF